MPRKLRVWVTKYVIKDGEIFKCDAVKDEFRPANPLALRIADQRTAALTLGIDCFMTRHDALEDARDKIEARIQAHQKQIMKLKSIDLSHWERGMPAEWEQIKLAVDPDTGDYFVLEGKQAPGEDKVDVRYVALDALRKKGLIVEGMPQKLLRLP